MAWKTSGNGLKRMNGRLEMCIHIRGAAVFEKSFSQLQPTWVIAYDFNDRYATI
jgi:hypothetical protein